MDKQKETSLNTSDADDKSITDDLSLNTIYDELKTFEYGSGNIKHPIKKKKSCLIRISFKNKQQLDKYRGVRSYNHFVSVLLKDYLLVESLKQYIDNCNSRKYYSFDNPFKHIDSGFKNVHDNE